MRTLVPTLFLLMTCACAAGLTPIDKGTPDTGSHSTDGSSTDIWVDIFGQGPSQPPDNGDTGGAETGATETGVIETGSVETGTTETDTTVDCSAPAWTDIGVQTVWGAVGSCATEGSEAWGTRAECNPDTCGVQVAVFAEAEAQRIGWSGLDWTPPVEGPDPGLMGQGTAVSFDGPVLSWVGWTGCTGDAIAEHDAEVWSCQ